MTLLPEVAYCLQTRAGERMGAEETYIPTTAEPLCANCGRTYDHAGNGAGPYNLIAHTLRAEGADGNEDGTGKGVPIIAFDPPNVTSPGNYSNPKAGDPCHTLTAEMRPPCIAFDWQAGHGKDDSFRGKSRQYVARKGEYTGSLQANKRDAVNYGMSVRRLTPRECERLQSFPDGHTAGESDSARYRMLGNAAPPVILAWIGGRLLEAVAKSAPAGDGRRG